MFEVTVRFVSVLQVEVFPSISVQAVSKGACPVSAAWSGDHTRQQRARIRTIHRRWHHERHISHDGWEPSHAFGQNCFPDLSDVRCSVEDWNAHHWTFPTSLQNWSKFFGDIHTPIVFREEFQRILPPLVRCWCVHTHAFYTEVWWILNCPYLMDMPTLVLFAPVFQVLYSFVVYSFFIQINKSFVVNYFTKIVRKLTEYWACLYANLGAYTPTRFSKANTAQDSRRCQFFLFVFLCVFLAIMPIKLKDSVVVSNFFFGSQTLSPSLISD